MARAWQLERQDTCACGHPRSETLQPAAEGAYRAIRYTCHACAERHRAEKALQDKASHGEADAAGALFTVVRD